MCLNLLWACTRPEPGIRFYIAQEGSDLNPGTKRKPLASLTGVRDAIRKYKAENSVTDTIWVLVEGGRYFMQEPLMLTEKDGGTKTYPVVYKAQDSDEIPQFIAGKKITGFQVDAQGIWRVKVPETLYYGWQFDQLYVNGQRASIARTPNTGFYKIDSIHQTIWERGTGRVAERARQLVGLSEEEFSLFKKVKKEEEDRVRFRAYHKWDFTIRYLDKVEQDSLWMYTSGKGMKPWNPLQKGHRIAFENFEAALDTAGEWYLSKTGELSYYPRRGETPENSEVIAPALPHFMLIKGQLEKGQKVQNIRFEGLSFQYSHYKIPPSGFEPNQAATSVNAAIELEGAENITFQNCEISHTGQHGIHFGQGTQYCKIEQCHLNDLGGGGVYIGTNTIVAEELTTQHIEVHNSIVQTGGLEFSPAVGIWIGHAANNRVTHNDIGDFRYSGVSVGWRWGYDHSPAKNNKVLYNHIHHIGWGLTSDMGAVYTLGSSEGTEVSHNIIHDVYSYSYGGWGLYTDEGSSHVKMENNLVYNTKSGGFHQHYGKENSIRNNIFAFADFNQLQATRVEKHRSFDFTHNIIVYDSGTLLAGAWEKIDAQVDNNCYWAYKQDTVWFQNKDLENWRQTGKDLSSIVADPGFENAASRDFRFASEQMIRQIGFKPFDLEKVGVLGDNNWKMKARLPEEKRKAFQELSKKKKNPGH
ncbi:right-handed parallel beta-helix repeat-containing protein [Rapidithrix thailandica]|uniref:Right-handed parallel beta-helix repeat-containing protein n=1 Tax=Rapidithrix thailandica TaxID=413964 RepID=A0AAW9SCG3_9BACT